ncbi:MAG: DUF554 domain-containing protein [Desulfosarcinaceae bacterium]|nr:DUF554 domain-containing protein [Desulfosarcinaceae bacterium]
MIGPFVNSTSVAVGSLLGASLGRHLPERLRTRLPLVFAIAAMGIGAVMVVKVKTMPAMVLALLFGTIIGELMNVEGALQKLANTARKGVEKVLPPPESGISEAEFMDKFTSMIVLFCASALGVFGPMREGMTGDPTLLIIKACIDFFTAIIFATSLGYTLATVAVPMLVVQSSLYYAATIVLPLTTPVMIDDFSAVGGLVLLATGFNIGGIAKFPLANMLPALFIAMPVSAMWNLFMG